MRRAAAALLALLAAASASGEAAARPLRVMSINDCADQYVLALLPPAQITSVSWLSRDAAASIMAAAAKRVPANHGAAEEVLRDHPDLVIAGAYATPTTRLLLKKLHFPLLELPSVDTFDDVRRQTRLVAAAVGAQARGEALIAQMDATLRQLAAAPGPAIRVAAWDGDGFAAEPGSMYDTVLKAAGAHNVASEARRSLGGAPGVEALLASAPRLLVEGEPGTDGEALRSDMLRNPVVRHFWGDRIVIASAAYYACGTPFSAAGALKLRRDLRAADARIRHPLPFTAPHRP